MKYRAPLFSVHGNEGRVSIYIEEDDAVLDLLEDVGREVDSRFIEDLVIYGRMANIKTPDGLEQYLKHRNQLHTVSLRIATMSTDEALDLAQQILIIVRAIQEPPAPPQLEIVK